MFWDMDGYCMYPYTDWGCHYEIWTMIDEKSYKPAKSEGMFSFMKKKKKKGKDDKDSDNLLPKSDKKAHDKYVIEEDPEAEAEAEAEDEEED
jgi:hypothetical protein